MREPHGPFAFELDRSADVPLAEQLRRRIRAAIEDGQLVPGARLPSWRDLAVQLGVSRGTVREAYERLVDDRLVAAAGAAGTHVAGVPPAPATRAKKGRAGVVSPLAELAYPYSTAPVPFQMGVPAQDVFPATLWARLFAASAREDAFAPAAYPDPRGEPALREQLAGYLALARGLRCTPDQIFVTGGFRGGLHLALAVLRIAGRTAWTEDPGFPLTRAGLEAAGARVVPVHVDGEGLDVDRGLALAPDAALALVTPGQHAPLGMTLSSRRRQALLGWAKQAEAWVIEDDYLGELQLDGRAAPALAAADPARVVHIGTFSKTLSPALAVGFVVAPPALAPRFAHVAGTLAPAPGRATQRAIAALMEDGHYLRHLRKMKRLYRSRRDALLARVGGEAAGLAVLLRLPAGSDDVALVRAARARGIGPAPLSPWYADRSTPGLLLGVATLSADRLDAASAALQAITGSGPGSPGSGSSRAASGR